MCFEVFEERGQCKQENKIRKYHIKKKSQEKCRRSCAYTMDEKESKGLLRRRREKYLQSTCQVPAKCSRVRASGVFPGGPIALPRNTLNTTASHSGTVVISVISVILVLLRQRKFACDEPRRPKSPGSSCFDDLSLLDISLGF
jgi:hypothetical protein